MAEYEPGSCNIGRVERRKRLVVGLIGFIASIAVIMGDPFDSVTSAGAFLMLLFLGFEGVYQYTYSFCTGFAHSGIYDVSEEGEDRKEVENEADREKDRRTAWRIHLYSAVSSLATSTALYLIYTAVV